MAWSCFKKRRRSSNTDKVSPSSSQASQQSLTLPAPPMQVVSTPPRPIHLGDPPAAPKKTRVYAHKRSSMCGVMILSTPSKLKLDSLKFINALTSRSSSSFPSMITTSSSESPEDFTPSMEGSCVPSVTLAPSAATTSETSNASTQEANLIEKTESIVVESKEEGITGMETTVVSSDTGAEEIAKVVLATSDPDGDTQTSEPVTTPKVQAECSDEGVVGAKRMDTSTVESPEAEQLLVTQRIEMADNMEFKTTAFHDVDDEDEVTNPNDINKWIGSSVGASDSNEGNEGDCHIDNVPVEGPRATERVSTVLHVVGVLRECVVEFDHIVKQEAEREEAGKGVEVNVTEVTPESQDEKAVQEVDNTPGVLASPTSDAPQHIKMEMTSADDETKTKVQPEVANLESVVVASDGKESIGREQTGRVAEVRVQEDSTMLKVPSIGRRGGRRRALTVVMNLPARSQVGANASVDNVGEKVDGGSSGFPAVPVMLKENIPRRGRANTVVRPVFPVGTEPAKHVAGTRVHSPKRRPRKGSVAFSVGKAIDSGVKIDDKSDTASHDGKENSDNDHSDEVVMSRGCGIKNVTLETGLSNDPITQHPKSLVVLKPDFVNAVEVQGLHVPEEGPSQAIKRRRGLTVCGVRGASPILIHSPSSNDNIVQDQDNRSPPNLGSGDTANHEDARDTRTILSEDVSNEAKKEIVVACFGAVNVHDRTPASVKPTRTVGGIRVRSPPRTGVSKKRQQPELCLSTQQLLGIEEEDEEDGDGASSMDQTILPRSSTLNMHSESYHQEHSTIMQPSGTDPDQTTVADISFKEPTLDWRYQPVVAHAFPFDDPVPKRLVWEEITGKPRVGASVSPTLVKAKRSFSSSALMKIKQHITKDLGLDRTKSTVALTREAVMPIIVVTGPEVPFPSYLVERPRIDEEVAAVGAGTGTGTRIGRFYGRALKATARSLSVPALSAFSREVSRQQVC